MFKNKLKEIRTDRGLTTSEISKQLNITQSSYNKYENGLRTPNLEQFKKICLILNCSPSVLLELDL